MKLHTGRRTQTLQITISFLFRFLAILVKVKLVIYLYYTYIAMKTPFIFTALTTDLSVMRFQTVWLYGQIT